MSIQRVIEDRDFYHVFQPIFNMEKWEEIGYEVLLRTNFAPNPEIAFQEAKKEKRLFELDSLSIRNAIRTYFAEGALQGGYLFLNIYPSTILHPNFPSFLHETMSDKTLKSQIKQHHTKIVLEISESEYVSVVNLKQFLERIDLIKEYGILIAIDDIGKGFDTLLLIIDLAPDFIKLDRYFSKDLAHSKQKQTFISLLKDYCDQQNCKVILEGIEKDLDLAIGKSLGLQYVQGYLLGRPGLLKNKSYFKNA